jgi:adenylate kinase
MKIILIGFPGSGKSTQAKKVGEYLKIPYLGTGDLVRSTLESHLTEYKEQVSKGFLLPDDIVFKIVSDKILEFDLNIGFVMEGYPRTLVQAKLLDLFLKERGTDLDVVINLTIGDDDINKRVLNRHQCKYCGSIISTDSIQKENSCPTCQKPDAFRVDDTKESLKKRIEIFRSKSLELLQYFEEKRILIDVNAGGTIEEVFVTIKNHLQSKMKKKEVIA